METLRLADIYRAAGYEEYVKRARECSTYLQYNAMGDGRKTLQSANFCNLRLCPLCTARRARKAAYQLSQIMNLVQAEHGARYLFLTLTVKNVLGPELGDALKALTASWFRLVRHRQVVRSVPGWYRAVEITRNADDGSYHPHIHAVLAVLPEYFRRSSDLYISHAEWVRRWRQAARLDYDPSVRIQCATDDGSVDLRGRKLVLEAAKYATKSSDYIDKRLDLETAAQVVRCYTEALWHRRMIAYGGWMKDAARAMGAENPEKDTDLVHIGDETIRSDVAELILDYHWNFGVGDYVLASKRLNALRVVDLATGEVLGPIPEDWQK